MSKAESELSILVRREVEARVIGPLVAAFAKEFGRERSLDILTRVIQSHAFEHGVSLAKRMGGNGVADYARGLDAWKAENALEYDILELSETRFSFNVTRCRYVDMYKQMGMADLGVTLSCNRDFKLIEGFNPRMKLVRTKTIMEGHDHCDFRITLE
jgi:hypothetical protein